MGLRLQRARQARLREKKASPPTALRLGLRLRPALFGLGAGPRLRIEPGLPLRSQLGSQVFGLIPSIFQDQILGSPLSRNCIIPLYTATLGPLSILSLHPLGPQLHASLRPSEPQLHHQGDGLLNVAALEDLHVLLQSGLWEVHQADVLVGPLGLPDLQEVEVPFFLRILLLMVGAAGIHVVQRARRRRALRGHRPSRGAEQGGQQGD